MQTNVIKNVAVALAIFLGTTAGFSMHAEHDANESFVRSTNKWNISYHATTNEVVGSHQGINARIKSCGSISVDGDSKCINKGAIVRLIETMKIVVGVNHRYNGCFVGSLIAELEKCPCPSTGVLETVDALVPMHAPSFKTGGTCSGAVLHKK